MTITTGILRVDEHGAAARILARSFDRSESAYRAQLRRSRGEAVLALRDGGDVIALCTRRDRDIGVAGRLVRAACLSAVCVTPERRGAGLGGRLFDDASSAASRDGLALAWLCADRPGLYERHGAVVCGHLWECAFDPRAASDGSGSLSGVLEAREDSTRVERFVRRAARAWSGRLVFDARERREAARPPRVASLVTAGDEVRARAVTSLRTVGTSTELVIHDLAALDAASARAVLAFVAARAPSATRARARLLPDPPLVSALSELAGRFTARRAWLVRVLEPGGRPWTIRERPLAPHDASSGTVDGATWTDATAGAVALFASARPSLPHSS